MRILVCAKQVPDSTVRVKVGVGGRSIDESGITWSISAYDEYAVELALEQKDQDPATTVTVVTLGPARTRDALRQALAMGCDDAILVTGPGSDSLQGLAIARALATVARDVKPDLVLCGRQASDDEQGLVGPALAEILGWPHVAAVTGFAPADAGPGSDTGPAGSDTGPAGSSKAVDVWKEVEGGHEVWRSGGPVVLTVQKSRKEPRYPSLPGIMKAKKKEIPERDASQLDLGEAPKIEIVKMEPPPARGGGKILKDGDVGARAAELVRLLREEAKVL